MSEQNVEIAAALNNLNATIETIPSALNKLKQQIATSLKQSKSTNLKDLLSSDKKLIELIKDLEESKKEKTPAAFSPDFFSDIYKKLGIVKNEEGDKKEKDTKKERLIRLDREGQKVKLFEISEPTLEKLSFSLKKSFKDALEEVFEKSPSEKKNENEEGSMDSFSDDIKKPRRGGRSGQTSKTSTGRPSPKVEAPTISKGSPEIGPKPRTEPSNSRTKSQRSTTKASRTPRTPRGPISARAGAGAARGIQTAATAGRAAATIGTAGTAVAGTAGTAGAAAGASLLGTGLLAAGVGLTAYAGTQAIMDYFDAYNKMADSLLDTKGNNAINEQKNKTAETEFEKQRAKGLAAKKAAQEEAIKKGEKTFIYKGGRYNVDNINEETEIVGVQNNATEAPTETNATKDSSAQVTGQSPTKSAATVNASNPSKSSNSKLSEEQLTFAAYETGKMPSFSSVANSNNNSLTPFKYNLTKNIETADGMGKAATDMMSTETAFKALNPASLTEKPLSAARAVAATPPVAPEASTTVKSPLEGPSKLPEAATPSTNVQPASGPLLASNSASNASVRPESSTNLPEIANSSPAQEENINKIAESILQLTTKLDEWIGTTETKAPKESASFSNVNNSKSTNTTINSYMGAGDEINSSRIQTEEKLFKYRLQY